MVRLKTPPIKFPVSDLLGPGKKQKVRVESDENLQTVGKSSRPITRALSGVKDTLPEQAAPVKRISQSQLPQDTSTDIIKLGLEVMMPEVEPSKMCSNTEIIEIVYASENPQFFRTRSRPINDNIDIISRVEGESESNMPQGLNTNVASTGGSLSEPTKKKRGRPKKYDLDGSGPGASGSSTVALGFSPSTLNSSTPAERKKERPPGSGRKQQLPSVDEVSNENEAQPEQAQSAAIASQLEAQPMEPQLGNIQSQSFASWNENDFPTGTASTNGISVERNSAHILQAITTKYGDITKGCTLQSEAFKIHSLKAICMVVQKLHNNCLAKLKSDDMKNFYEIVIDAESVKFNVEWLRQYLDDIVKAMEEKNKHEKLRREVKQKEEELETALKLKKEEKEKLEHQINQLEEQLWNEKIKGEELTAQINSLSTPFLTSII